MDILNKLKNRDIDQLIIRIGKACNFKCLFCNVGDNEKRIKNKFSKKELVKEFLYQFSKINIKNQEILVSISGGEPSLFKEETIFISKFIYKFGKIKGIKVYLELQTNASNLDLNFLLTLKTQGLIHILVSYHSSEKKSFEKLIGVNFKNLNNINYGIDLIKKTKILMSFNIIFTKINYRYIKNTIKFLLNRFDFVNQYNIGYFQPNGYGEKNYDFLFIDFSEVIHYYLESIDILIKNKKNVLSHFTGLPICLLGKYKKYSLEYLNNIKHRKNKNIDYYTINKNNNINKVFKKECFLCIYNNLCNGIWKNFKNINKLNLLPQKYKLIDFNILKQLDSKLYIKFQDQIIISSDYENINNLIGKSINEGIAKITLFIKNDNFDLSKNLFFGFNNIQINKKFAYNNYNFIINNIPYFEFNRINIDIFVEKNNISNFNKFSKFNYINILEGKF